MKRFAYVITLLILTACASDDPRPSPPPRASLEAQPRPRPPVLVDTCGARPLQYLVGRPRTEIPVPLRPSLRRVLCLTCPMTQDYAPMRQTILYDSETGLVREVKCG